MGVCAELLLHVQVSFRGEGATSIDLYGVNPSTATPSKLDRTLLQVQRTAMSSRENDGWMMLNLYPQRVTNPNDLDSVKNDRLMRRNYKIIAKVIKQVATVCDPVDIWCAWGGLIRKRTYLWVGAKQIFDLCSKYSVRWLRRGPLTKDGDPHHPLFVKREEELKQFDMHGYLVNHAHIIEAATNEIDF